MKCNVISKRQQWRCLKSFSMHAAYIDMLTNLLLNHLLFSHSVYSCKYAELMPLLCLYMFVFCASYTHTPEPMQPHTPTTHSYTQSHTQCPVSHGTVAARPNIWHCVRHWQHTWLHLVFLFIPKDHRLHILKFWTLYSLLGFTSSL